MRTFDWFILGAVSLLYSQAGSDRRNDLGHDQAFEAGRDSTLWFAYSVNGQWFMNWAFIFAAISAACFLVALVRMVREKNPSGSNAKNT